MLPVYILILFFSLQDAALIKFVKFDSNVIEFKNNTVNSENLQLFNEELLGIRAPKKSNKNHLLFRRPNALVILDVQGLETLDDIQGEDFEFDGEFTTDPLLEKMQNVLNKDQLQVLKIDTQGTLNGKSEKLISSINKKHNDEESSESQTMNKQLTVLNKLGTALKTFKKEDNIIQVYRISLNVPSQLDQVKTTDDTKLLQTGLENVINNLRKVYGDQTVVEIYSKASDEVQKQELHKKRKNIRKKYQVAEMAHQDYPAMFMIISTVVVVFSFALLAAVISFWDNQDMGKNSIIYRLTNNRKKKD